MNNIECKYKNVDTVGKVMAGILLNIIRWYVIVYTVCL